MRRMLLAVTPIAALALPSVASAKVVHCGNLAGNNLFHIAGSRVGCTTAKAVAKAEAQALLRPGSGAKHYIKVKGKRWHYTWHNRNTSPTTQVEYYTARNGKATVTFQTHGAN